ncbi:MAG: acyl-CoA/acyl-ACP dehydrogenase [Chloroflexi bacterium]|nr:acyl-CoA/acyl-ACP dehydrogenase [Chloroflexota bacterium]
MRGGLRELLGRACEIGHVRAVAYDGDGRDAELWQTLADAGWTAVTIPEADGGAGLRFEDLILVLEEAGRAVLPLPLTTTLLAARTIAGASPSPLRSEWLSRIAGGTASVTLALRGVNAEQPGCVAERKGNGWQLSGSRALVPYGPLADLALVEATLTDGGRGLFVVPADAPEIEWSDLQLMDRSVPQYEMSLNGVAVAAEASLFGDKDGGDAIDRLLDEWRAGLAAESLGVGERMLELTVAYAKEREQFGRPIGANQAVKARIADMAAAVERMRAAVYHAAVKIDAEAEDRVVAVAMAKVATAEPGAFVGGQAIHVHGGIGYTWEHDLHLYFKRIKSNELLLGDGTMHLARIAEAVL